MGQKILIVKGNAGLADRIYQLLAGIMYAKVANRRIVVDWTDECFGNIQRCNLFDLAFELRSVGQNMLDPPHWESEDVAPRIWAGCLNMSTHEMVRQEWKNLGSSWNASKIVERLSVDTQNRVYGEDLAVFLVDKSIDRLRTQIDARFPEFREMSEDEIRRNLFFNHLAIRKEVSDMIENFCRDSFGDKDIIGVHVRMTNESGPRSFSSRYYFQEIDRLLKRNPTASIFLATDNAEVRREFEGRFPDVIEYKKWLPEAGIPLHQKGTAVPDTESNFRDAVVEMLLLARCSWLVVPGLSGFSNMAALISGISLDNIISIHSRVEKSFFRRIGKRLKRSFRSIVSTIKRNAD